MTTSHSETIASADGRSFAAYVSEPASPNGHAVILLQEIFGVTAHVRRVADRFAQDGTDQAPLGLDPWSRARRMSVFVRLLRGAAFAALTDAGWSNCLPEPRGRLPGCAARLNS